jgi:phosphatidylglycerol:prolipoprotein diacylglycerol transferase
MRPILLKIPALPLLVACFIVAVIAVIRDSVPWRGKRPTFPWTSAWAVGGAVALLIFIGKLRDPGADVLANLRNGFVPIYAYGVMLGTSLVVGWFIVMNLAKNDGLDQQEAGTIYMWSAIWSIIGSRLLWYFTDTNPKTTIADIPMINQGGLVAYGGMIGGFLASVYCCRKRGIPLLQWADVAAPSVVLGTAITRVGCLLFGCDYGKPSNLPWAIRFPAHSPAWNDHLNNKWIQDTALRSLPVHPTQIYESLVGLFLFGLLMLIRRYRKFSGEVFLGWVFGYGILRPLIEQVRGDEDRGVYAQSGFQWSTSTIIGFVSVALGLGLLIVLIRKYRRDPEGSKLWLHPVAVAPAAAETKGQQGASKRRKKR